MSSSGEELDEEEEIVAKKPEREFSYIDPESKGQIPYVSTAFGKSWKLLQDPTLPESVAPTRVYRVDGYCPHSYDGKDGLRDPVEDPRAIQHRETPQLSLPLPAFAEQEYDEAAAAELESGQPGLLVKGFPTSLSEAEVAAAFGCTGERPKASLFSRHGLEASTNGEDKSQGSVGTSAVFAFDRACHAAYALHHAKDSEVLKSAMIQFGQVGVLEALVQNPSLTNRDSAVKDADDEFVLAAPVARNMGFPSRIGPAGVSAKNSMLSFSVGIGKVGLGKTKRERQASPPRPDGRPEDDASTVHQDKRNASPPRPVTRDETLHPSASGHGAGSHVGSARSPARADKRTSSPARPERERAGDGSSEGAALAAPGSALASAIDKDAEILLQIQCAELEGTGVSASGIKALREVHKELRVAALSALKKAVAAGRAAASRDELWTQVLSETMLDLVGAPPPMPPHEDAPPPPPPQYPDAPAPPHGQAQHGGHPPQQQPSAPPGAHAPYGHTGEMHAQAAYGGGSGGHEWGATGGMMPAASSGPHAPHHAAYAHPPHYPHDHRPHQYPAGGEMMHTHQHPPPHYHGPPPHYDGPPQHFNEGPPYSEGPRQHHPHPSHHHPGPTFPDSQHGSGPPGPYHGPPNGPRGHGPPPHYGPGGHGAYHHKTHHHQGPPYHHDHPPMNMHGPPAGGGGPYGPGGPGGPGPGGPPGPGPPPHMGPGRPRDLHEMLEAQFRHAGQRLADLDHDALESLKAMDEPCQQAAVKLYLQQDPRQIRNKSASMTAIIARVKREGPGCAGPPPAKANGNGYYGPPDGAGPPPGGGGGPGPGSGPGPGPGPGDWYGGRGGRGGGPGGYGPPRDGYDDRRPYGPPGGRGGGPDWYGRGGPPPHYDGYDERRGYGGRGGGWGYDGPPPGYDGPGRGPPPGGPGPGPPRGFDGYHDRWYDGPPGGGYRGRGGEGPPAHKRHRGP